VKKEVMSATSPVLVQGHLDPALGRWRWLVKWFLAIPHLVVLVLLWVAFLVLTVVAGVAIAFTGRYPRRIFDFNVGVMRWTWRVEFYAFTLATDRYPPFTLAAVDDDPAKLDVEYPERLSRGLVWVKWWLLALPHYLVLAFFTGGDTRFAGGLVALLSLIAGVTLALRREYPESIFDFVMGMHRWSWRVVAYASLMTDAYPPFRIDNGPDEPGSGPTTDAMPLPVQPPLAA
jgi:hypothetical protein